MGELLDRRARKKARTRAEIRDVAQRLFQQRGFDAVTVADIAAAADVSVQTVFNHFPAKEELFFDGRVPWVDGPADAVRNRPAGLAPLTALRAYLVQTTTGLVAAHATTSHRSYVTTLDASPSLRAYERELLHAAETRLGAALYEAWSDGSERDELRTAASVTAAMWLGAARALVLDRRSVLLGGADPARTAAEVSALGESLLGQLEQGVAAGPVRAA